MTATTEIPSALVERRRFGLLHWLLPLCALAFACWISWSTWSGGGVVIHVLAGEGHGIKAGDALRYRGIDVGTIERVALAEDQFGVDLVVRLQPDAAELARDGSRFWIVRPHLSLDSVEGLETVIGARYLAVRPGPRDGEEKLRFEALAEPPLKEELAPEGLLVTLEAPSRFALAPGAPLSYRQIVVGFVTDVDLSSDATSVEVGVYVRPTYRSLVRSNTRFWEVGGLEVDLELVGGLKVEMESVRSLLVGGIALATPTEAGPEAESGRRFRLHAGPEEEWLEWRPALPLGEALVPEGDTLPDMLLARLTWTDKGLLRRSRERTGWLLPVAGGVLGPADLLSPVERARGDGAFLEVQGERFALSREPEWTRGGLSFLRLALAEVAPWPDGRTRRPGRVEDCLILAGRDRGLTAVSAPHLAPAGDSWRIDRALVLEEEWHGAAVLSRADSRVVGLLLVGDDGARIALLPGEPPR